MLRSSLEGQVYSVDDEIQSNSLELKMSRLRRKLAKRSRDCYQRHSWNRLLSS
ncbi:MULTISPECIES: hypothetical protein [Rhizobiaceae]|uniref:hypothetical protein n=1 Tax=Rhizobiaceae TaxID=82115 RepID=UPI00352B3CF3